MFRTIADIPAQQTVLCRVDLNSPVEDGTVQDNKRFERHAETVRRLLDDGHAAVLLAHQGRPGRNTFISLEQHAEILSDHLKHDVRYIDDVDGKQAKNAMQTVQPGETILLENTRFSDHELAERSPTKHAQNGFVPALAPYADCYVNDAYSAAHRAHASLVGFPQVMDAYAGNVMNAEYTNNSRIQEGLDGTTTMVLGGKKAEDVLYVMERLINDVDNFLVGGIIGELFLRAEGHDVGYDVDDEARSSAGASRNTRSDGSGYGSQFMHEQWLQHRDQLNRLLKQHRGKIHLPLDLAHHNTERERAEVSIGDAAKTEPYWDIGHDTVDKFSTIIKQSDAVFVKGALGVFEDEKFRYGTKTLLETIGRQDCFSVIGGGDTSRCVDMYDLEADNFSHVSIAGGAYIRALAGETLPAVEALKQSQVQQT